MGETELTTENQERRIRALEAALFHLAAEMGHRGLGIDGATRIMNMLPLDVLKRLSEKADQ